MNTILVLDGGTDTGDGLTGEPDSDSLSPSQSRGLGIRARPFRRRFGSTVGTSFQQNRHD